MREGKEEKYRDEMDNGGNIMEEVEGRKGKIR